MYAFYKNHRIRLLKGRGYEVLGMLFPSLAAATERIDTL